MFQSSAYPERVYCQKSNTHMMSSHSERLLKVLKSYFDACELTDIILIAEGTEVSCHRNVLAACSPYFRAMFSLDDKESKSGRVELHDLSACTLRFILEYMYTGTVDISNNNVQALLTASNMMQLEHLVELCIDYVKGEINVDNCVEICQFADFNNLIELRKTAKKYILDHFDEVRKTKAILSAEPFFLNEILSEDELNVSKEEHVFELLEDWVEDDFDNRCKYCRDLFEVVRFPLIEKDIRSSLITTNKLIKLTYSSQEVLEEQGVDKTLLMDAVTEEKITCTLRKGMLTRRLLIFSGGTTDDSKPSFTCFDPETRRNYHGIVPISPHDAKCKIEHFKLVVSDESTILLIGGVLYEKQQLEGHCAAQKNVFKYSQQDRKWVDCSSMNTGRCCFAASCYSDRVYVFGGLTTYPRGDVTDHVEFYDASCNFWQQVQPLPVGICRQTASTFADSVYIFGGLDDEGAFLNTVLMYSISRDTWTLVETQLIKPRIDAVAITFREKIYVVGGADKHENNTTMEIYDPIRNRWSYGERFPEERKIMAVTLFHDCLYVYGGFKHSTNRPGHYRRTRTIETRDLHKFDIKTGKWSKEVKNVQYGNSTCCASAIVNVTYLTESEFISS